MTEGDEEPIHTRFLKGLRDPKSIRRYELVLRGQVERLLSLMEDYLADEIPPEEFFIQFASEIYGVKLWLREVQKSESEESPII